MNKKTSLMDIFGEIILKKLTLEIENRKSLNDYGFPTNNATILGYINPADNDLWDALLFGYKHKFKYDEKYKTNQLIGIIWISDGNHKLLFKIPGMQGFSKARYKKEINKYITKYKTLNKLNAEYIHLVL